MFQIEVVDIVSFFRKTYKNVFEQNPYFRDQLFYNFYSDVIKKCINISKFKAHLKNQLITKCYYSVHEYLSNSC